MTFFFFKLPGRILILHSANANLAVGVYYHKILFHQTTRIYIYVLRYTETIQKTDRFKEKSILNTRDSISNSRFKKLFFLDRLSVKALLLFENPSIYFFIFAINL